jgi:hypothetical protein
MPDLRKHADRASMKLVDLRGAYYNPKDQVRALEQVRERLPGLDTPELTSTKRDRPRRARQLGDDQIKQLVAGYQSARPCTNWSVPGFVDTGLCRDLADVSVS